ncbi:hypothetical protein C4546_02165 [Candidatus Parcubacteria bacterium]|jgi:hypothetical protein|nr:MAG: hypothetical protein C4546_02165 [Candidatus Parcubacteria bacterium]
MAIPENKIKPNGKKVLVKTKATTYSAVRLSQVLMTAAAMFATGVISASLIIAALPKSIKQSVAKPMAPLSVNESLPGEVLVKFKSGLTQSVRLAAINTALKQSIKCVVTRTYVEKKWLKSSVKTASSLTSCQVKLKSLSPVASVVEVVNDKYPDRAKRAQTELASSTRDDLKNWYILRVTGNPDLNSLVKALVGAKNVVKVEKNPKLSAAMASAYNPASVEAAQNSVYSLAGDVNSDGIVNWADAKYVENHLFTGGPAPAKVELADFNGNRNVDQADLVLLTKSLNTGLATPKDLNADGKVDLNDAYYLNNYVVGSGSPPATLSNADLNVDGHVGIVDVILYSLYVQNSAGQPTCLKGDANADGLVNLQDAYYISDNLFRNGASPAAVGCADVSGNGEVDISDALILTRLQAKTPLVKALDFSAATYINEIISPLPVPQEFPVPAFLTGDVNGDNKVDYADALFLANYVFNSGPSPEPLSRGDLNADNKVDVADVNILFDLTLPYSQFAPRLSLADLNSDGKVDESDAQIIFNFSINKISTIDVSKADITNDTKVDFVDFYVLNDYLKDQLTTTFTIGSLVTDASYEFIFGDVNGDNQVNLTDADFLLAYLYKKGPAPSPLVRGDINGNNVITILDVTALLTLLNTQSENTPVLDGDINKDQVVDGKDVDVLFDALRRGTVLGGDINRDGRNNDLIDLFALVDLLKLDENNKPLYDFNNDGVVNLSDVDFLLAYLYKNGPAPTNLVAADLNSDGQVSMADVIAMLNGLKAINSLQFTVGDANKDGLITPVDVDFLLAYLYKNGPAPDPLGRGDLTNDGKVNMIDVVWLLNRLYPTVNPPAATNRIKVGILDTGLNKEPGTVSATAVINYDVPGNKKDDDKNGYVDDAFGWNALTNGSTRDFNGHGTAVAKVIHTIAPKAELFPVTVLNQQGVGDCKTVSQGINYAVRQGADIINISASGKGICTLLKDVVAYAQANGVIVIMAAGNDSTNVVNLQSRTDALVVGAAESGKRVKYTNAANIYAPDRDVKSQKRGTSYSAAYVSGGAALVLTKSNNLTVDQLQNQLVNTAKLYTSGVKMIDLQEATK